MKRSLKRYQDLFASVEICLFLCAMYTIFLLPQILTGYEFLPSSIADGFRTELGTEIKSDELVKLIER